ncbi:methyltransferase domain-containing protein [bacterium]|nr:methyltransferase domain-containing protein [bacterium]
MPDERRVYYDHEPAYKKIAAQGGRGWDDFCPSTDSYDGLVAFLASNLAPRRGDARPRALELGCGGGQASLLLARAGFETLGVDFAETAVELARKNAKEAGLDARFERGDVLALDVPEGAFDLVVDNHVFHCIVGEDDRRAFVATVRRALSPSGVFFSEAMSGEGGFDPGKAHADPRTRVAWNHTRFWVTEGELRGELASAGLEIVRFERKSQPPGEGDLFVTVSRRGP